MLQQYIGLVSQVAALGLGDLTEVAGALQKQVQRDLSPIWGITGMVSAFASLDKVPPGYWKVVIVDDVKGAAGVHLDDNSQPYALVENGPTWSLTASHECLEMLVDPWGNRLVAGYDLSNAQKRVEYLVEICDPSEDSQFAYTVNGVLVSDFYTPHFFDPVGAAGVRYSFTGAISHPREVLSGGYLSWHDPADNHWYQLTKFGGKAQISDLGIFDGSAPSLRAWIDAMTPGKSMLSKQDLKGKKTKHLIEAREAHVLAAGASATSLQRRIDLLMGAAAAHGAGRTAGKSLRSFTDEAAGKTRRSQAGKQSTKG